MTYEDILFLIGFFLVIAFFVGCKHKPATLSGWLAFAFLSFIVIFMVWGSLAESFAEAIYGLFSSVFSALPFKDKGYFDPSDFTFKR